MPLRFALLSFLPLALVLVATAPAVAAEPSHGVLISAGVSADFEASPTLYPLRPDLHGGSNSLVNTGWVENLAVGEFFHEIYEGMGESGTSRFEVEFSGLARLASEGGLSIDLLGFDQNNASASWWTTTSGAGYYQWLEFSGPTNIDGNYVITFTTNLGFFSAENKQPPGFTYIWRAGATTSLVAEPLDTNFPRRTLSTAANVKEACPSLSLPPCQFESRVTSATGSVTVPGSNPVLRVAHSLGVGGRSMEASASGSLSMDLPPGVFYTAYQPIPEPSLMLGHCGALFGLLAVRRLHSKICRSRGLGGGKLELRCSQP